MRQKTPHGRLWWILQGWPVLSFMHTPQHPRWKARVEETRHQTRSSNSSLSDPQQGFCKGQGLDQLWLVIDRSHRSVSLHLLCTFCFSFVWHLYILCIIVNSWMYKSAVRPKGTVAIKSLLKKKKIHLHGWCCSIYRVLLELFKLFIHKFLSFVALLVTSSMQAHWM